MVSYFGRHSAKIFIRTKLTRFGLKIWCLYGSNGYSHNMKIYQKKGEKVARSTFGILRNQQHG